VCPCRTALRRVIFTYRTTGDNPTYFLEVILSSESGTVNEPDPRSAINSRTVLVVLPKLNGKQTVPAKDATIKRLISGVFYTTPEALSANPALSAVDKIVFRRSKVIPKMTTLRSGLTHDTIFSLLVYKFNSPTEQQKKKAQRLIRRSPCIRLRPGVLLHPSLRARDKVKLYGKFEGSPFLDAQGLVSELEKLGATVWRFSRLKITSEGGISLVEQCFNRMLTEDLGSIKSKLDLTMNNQALDEKKKRQTLTQARSKYKALTMTLKVLYVVWKLDSRKELKQTYNMLLRVRNSLTA
jgi:hypothetical protein